MFGLPDITLDLLKRYFDANPKIEAVYVYGSRAMGNYRVGSDVDLAIWSNVDTDISGAVKTDLEALPTPYLYDVTDYRHITHLPLKEHIDKYGQVLFKRKP